MINFTKPVALGMLATLLLCIGVVCVIAACKRLLYANDSAAWLFAASLISLLLAKAIQSASNKALAKQVAGWESQIRAQFVDTIERMQP